MEEQDLRDKDISLIQALRQDINAIFSKYIKPVGSGPYSTLAGLPPLDLRETDGEYILEIELPGVDDNDLQITTSRNNLVIKGEKKCDGDKVPAGNFLYKERTSGPLYRIITFPEDIDDKNIFAELANGILKIRFSKTAEKKKSVRKIDIRRTHQDSFRKEGAS